MAGTKGMQLFHNFIRPRMGFDGETLQTQRESGSKTPTNG